MLATYILTNTIDDRLAEFVGKNIRTDNEIDSQNIGVDAKSFVAYLGCNRNHDKTADIIKAANFGDITVVFIDQHLDFFLKGCGTLKAKIDPFLNYNWKTSYAHFLGEIIKEDKVKQVICLGVNQRIPSACSFFYHDNGAIIDLLSKIQIYVPDGERICSISYLNKKNMQALENCEKNPSVKKYSKIGRRIKIVWVNIADFNPDLIPTRNVYITTDFDVFNGILGKLSIDPKRQHVGSLSLDKYLNLITAIGQNRNVVSADYCGLFTYILYDKSSRKTAIEETTVIHKKLVSITNQT